MTATEYRQAIRRETYIGKNEHPGSIIGVRAGDFYEVIGADALRVAAICGIKSSRVAGDDLTGIPYFSIGQHTAAIIAAGFTFDIRTLTR